MRLVLVIISCILLYIWSEIETKEKLRYKYTRKEIEELEEIEKRIKEL